MSRRRANPDRGQALYFLIEVQRRAAHYADRLDPNRRRDYGRDPVLAALDAIVRRATHALDCEGPAEWRELSALDGPTERPAKRARRPS